MTSPPSPTLLDISSDLIPLRYPKPSSTTTLFSDFLSPPLVLHEDLKQGCGGQLWPAGMVLARYLLERQELVRGKVIIELGAGGGLVGLALALAFQQSSATTLKPPTSTPAPSSLTTNLSPDFTSNSATTSTSTTVSTSTSPPPSPISTPSSPQPSLLLTDLPPLLPLQTINITLNALPLSKILSLPLPWGSPLPASIPSPYRRPDIVLAADCVYYEPAMPLLEATLGELLGLDGEKRDTVCYFCLKKRRKADMRFVARLKRRFEVVELRRGWEGEEKGVFLYTIRRK